jgi:YVTN family beta-propeller protein
MTKPIPNGNDMTYSLGVDLGTTFVAAAVARPNGVEMFTLGDRDVVAPAVVYVREDGSVITGDAAARRAVRHPEMVGRDIKRMLGESSPFILRNAAYPVTALLGAQLRDVVRKVVDTEGEPPERVVLTHPAGWEPFHRELFAEVTSAAGLEAPQLVSEPEAAVHHAMAGRLQDGQIVAIYDLGGGAFQATVVRKQADGLEILGTPERINGLGGDAFDDRVLSYVDGVAGHFISQFDFGNPQSAVAFAQLRQDCVLAKEALSRDREAVIPVFLPGRHFEIRLTRDVFEGLVHKLVESTIQALSRAVQSAGLTPSDLTSVLLLGGSSQIPLIAELVSREFGRSTVDGVHPKYAVALGAASIAAGSAATASMASTSIAAASMATASMAAVPAARRDEVQMVPPMADSPTVAVAAVAPADTQPRPEEQKSRGREPALPEASVRSLRSRVRMEHLPVAAAAAAAVLVLALVFLLNPAGTAVAPPVPDSARIAPPVVPPPAPPSAPTVVSVAQPTVAGTFGTGAGPRAGAVTPDGKYAYVAGSVAKSISVVDLATNAVAAEIPIEAGAPFSIAFTPDGSRAYVAVQDQTRRTGSSVVVLDTTTRAVTATIPTDKYPYSLAVSPDGRQVYVPTHDTNAVSVIDTATNTVVNKIAVKPNPHSVAFSVDGRRAYVANHASNLVTVVDTGNGAVLAEIPVAPSPHSVAMSPDSTRVYVVNYDADSVTVIDPVANTVTGTIPVQSKPQSIEFAHDGKHAYVVNDGSNTVSVIDTATSKVTATLGVGTSPTEVFLAPDGRHAYVTNIGSNDVTVLNIGA